MFQKVQLPTLEKFSDPLIVGLEAMNEAMANGAPEDEAKSIGRAVRDAAQAAIDDAMDKHRDHMLRRASARVYLENRVPLINAQLSNLRELSDRVNHLIELGRLATEAYPEGLHYVPVDVAVDLPLHIKPLSDLLMRLNAANSADIEALK